MISRGVPRIRILTKSTGQAGTPRQADSVPARAGEMAVNSMSRVLSDENHAVELESIGKKGF